MSLPLPESAPQVLPDGAITLHGTKSPDLALTWQPGALTLAALRLEILPEERLGGTVSLTATLQRAGGKEAQPIVFSFADSPTKSPRYANGDEIPGIVTGWHMFPILIRPESGVRRADFQQHRERNGIDTRMVRLPEAGHGMGRPSQWLQTNLVVVDWYNKYLVE